MRIHPLIPLPKRFRERVEIVLGACHPEGDLERLVVRRYVLRRSTLGLFRLTQAARQLDDRIMAALRRKALLAHPDWLRLYQPVDAPSPETLSPSA